jgi:general secretion pathway protein D
MPYMLRVNTVREDSRLFFRSLCGSLLWSLSAIVFFCGCSSINEDHRASEGLGRETFPLKEITAERGRTALSDLGLGIIASAADPNTLLLSGPPDELKKADIVLGLIDTDDPYVIETLAPAAMARTLPSNQQIARAIGHVAIGTFAALPDPDEARRGIIDIQGESIVAIVPASLWPEVRAIVEFGPETARLRKELELASVQDDRIITEEPTTASPTSSIQQDPSIANERGQREASTVEVVSQLTEFGERDPKSKERNAPPPSSNTQQDKIISAKPQTVTRDVFELQPAATAESELADETSRGVLKPSVEINTSPQEHRESASVAFPDGDDVIELTLPEKINLAQLIDLVGEYLHLDCMYDAERIGNQVITLKLHSKLRSEITVRDLYSLLETILKFRGLVMTRYEGNLVTIVPAAEALDVDPELLEPGRKIIEAGDMVVTRIFELQHVEVSSVINLLQNMKLSVATSAIAETQTLFVTCYAHRMARIEQLVRMVDRPGRPKEFRFRRLNYTAAQSITQKVQALAAELQDIPITVAAASTSEASSRSSRRGKNSTESSSPSSTGNGAVYLDTDERTNRILMIGYEELLATVEGLIDILDVPQDDLPTLKIYGIMHVSAQEVVQKLNELGITEIAAATTKGGRSAKAGAAAETPRGGLRIVVLEATNSLLINAARQEHDQIRTVVDYIDVPLQDLRILKVYDIQHADADEVVQKLQELGFIGGAPRARRESPRISRPRASPAAPATQSTMEGASVNDLQMVVLEATNSLLVYTTEAQHQRLQAIIPYVDIEVRRERIPYEIYFLENQEPEHMAEVLGQLVQETVTDKEGKIQEVVRKTDDEVIIIPDTGTFSLIVYANRKNQEWVADLVRQLDKRRPQVLIDVTLVEINKTEAFSYDLNLIQSFPDLTATSGLTGTISSSVSSSDIMGRLSTSGRNRFVDYQSNGGDFTGFYGDQHINLLLQAMQSKNYGRILAKPKILVNDNQPGTIKTADTTYVRKTSSIPVSSGGAGTDTTLIETAVSFEPHEAGIKLDITPHISQGELLRLDIGMTRSDFRDTEDPDKPPDTTASELTTTVFVPDGSTIILGGLEKLNQNKGGTKVPLLGDIPLVGGLFRSINNRDTQNMLYIFVKAEIIRPGSDFAQGMAELDAISDKNRAAFEKREKEFQDHQEWPGLKPKPVDPKRVLEAQ